MPFLSERRLDRMSRAVVSGRIIPYLVLVTAATTLGAALAVRLFARGEFTTFGESVWWAAQTVTTVGYGDVIPKTPFSKAVAVAVMFFGVTTISLTTAVVTSVVISTIQRRGQFEPHEDRHHEALQRIEERLRAIERRLEGG